MNIIDVIVLVLLAIYVLNGLFRGFLPSLMNLGSFFVSWIVSFLAYPLLSKSLVGNGLFSSFQYYVEGTEWLPNFELSRLNVADISGEQLSSIMEQSKLPPPFDTAITHTVETQAFADQGVTTLGDYFNLTIYNVIINIIAVLILFVCIRVVLTLLVNAFCYASNLPQLRHFDYPMGGAVGLIRGFFSMYLLFALIPIAMVFLRSVDFVTSMVNESTACGVFYSGSIILRVISGTI